MASREPVDAPEGTAARPMVPDSSSTSHSMVGLPRLSRISRPTMSTMALMGESLLVCRMCLLVPGMRSSGALDEHHAHHRSARARLACAGVLGGIVEGAGLRGGGKFQHDEAIGLPVALEHLHRAAARADLGAV